MSRLVVVSNRVAPIKAGKVAAGGLAVGVYDALRQAGGIWFGWSGEVSATPTINTEEVGNITYVTLPLNKRDYDQYYRGFSNATLWPIFHYRIDWPATAARNTTATGGSTPCWPRSSCRCSGPTTSSGSTTTT